MRSACSRPKPAGSSGSGTALKIHSHLDLEYAIRRLEKDQPDSLTFLGKVGVGISEEKLENGQLDAYDRVFLVLDDEENYRGEVEQLPDTLSVSILLLAADIRRQKNIIGNFSPISKNISSKSQDSPERSPSSTMGSQMTPENL